MKIQFKYLLAASLALLLLFTPMPALAGNTAVWKAQPLPLPAVDTVFGDSRYIDPAWMTNKITVTYQGTEWVTGMDAFLNVPVRLISENGLTGCTFLDISVFQSFFDAVNAGLTPLTTTTGVPIFDNGAGSYIREGGQTHYEVKPEMTGLIAETIQNMILTGVRNDIKVELTPELLTLVTDSSNITTSPDFILIGSCTTSYRTSGANRSNNIVVGASRLNDLVVMPGQTVSVSDTLLPRTRANGFREAGVYLNGVHTTGMGGGVCQISSTVYNAVKNAGLTVTQRHPHSMPVSYLPKGLDAAIASGSKDLQFRNDYSTPVVIKTETKDKKLTVNVLVWNQELNGRSYKLWAKQTGALSAKTYFTTYQDGEEVSTVFVGTSNYKPYREEGEEIED